MNKDSNLISKLFVSQDLSLPRLLFLHGGGVTASIFTVQSRALLKLLTPYFRCVFVDAPFLCDPHPDVVQVYASYGPFRRWLRWLPSHSAIDAESCIDEVTYAIQSAMLGDDQKGATGPWVGLVGFSQGAKLAGSMLLEQQVREAALGGEGRGPGVCGVEGVHWRFGILMAGRGPLVVMDQIRQGHCKALESAAGSSGAFEFGDGDWVEEDAKIALPTVHVHGLADPGLELHRRLLNEYCEPSSTRLIEWDGSHRIPFKSKDVEPVVAAIFDVAKRTGVTFGQTHHSA